MRLISQPEKWQCGLAAFAMLFDLSLESAVQTLGHDGSEILYPELKEPECRKGFTIPELVDAAYKLDHALIQFDAVPITMDANEKVRSIYPEVELESRLMRILAQGEGLILGQYASKKWHMVCWDGKYVLDPHGPRIYSFNDVGIETITIESFYLKKKIL